MVHVPSRLVARMEADCGYRVDCVPDLGDVQTAAVPRLAFLRAGLVLADPGAGARYPQAWRQCVYRALSLHSHFRLLHFGGVGMVVASEAGDPAVDPAISLRRRCRAARLLLRCGGAPAPSLA